MLFPLRWLWLLVLDFFFEENRFLSTQLTNYGYDWEIHPAFRWALQPEESFNMFKKIELSADDDV